MKRVLVTLACFLVLAAPASAARKPMDFELAGPRVVAADAGAYRSPVLQAPRRFDLVGMRWSSRLRPTIAIRARKAGGAWTHWTRVPADPDDAPDAGSRERSPRGFSAPLWTGEADYIQYSLSRRVPGLRLHFVSVPRVLPGARAVALMARAKQADEPGQPPIIQPRSAWGAQDCPPRSAPDYGDVQAAFIHHTVTANDYTPEEVPSIILSICRFHRNSNGWNDIGYNFLVDKFGTIWEGRAGGVDQAVVGAQAQGYNSHTTGIADIGNHQDVPASDAELNAFASLIRWKLPLHGAPTQGTVTLTSGGGSLNRYQAGTPVTIDRIAGHRDGDKTSCPGDAFYAQLPQLRAMVGNVAPAPQARTKIAASISPGAVVYPQQATVTGTVRQMDGTPVAGVIVAVQAYGTAGWRNTWQATTGADGSFTVQIGARLSHQVRVQWGGDESRLPAVSPTMNLNVVPELKIERSASRRPVGQTVTLSGTVQPNKTKLMLIVERRAGGTKARGALALRASRGRFRRTYRFHSTGLFRFQVAFAGDKANAAARSASVYVRATPGSVASVPPSGNPGGGVSPG
jgi:hypothetical protein